MYHPHFLFFENLTIEALWNYHNQKTRTVIMDLVTCLLLLNSLQIFRWHHDRHIIIVIKFHITPISLIIGNGLHSASMTFPEFHWADSSRCSLGKGGNGRPERNHQEQPWSKVLFPHQGIHTISLSYFADNETPKFLQKTSACGRS